MWGIWRGHRLNNRLNDGHAVENTGLTLLPLVLGSNPECWLCMTEWVSIHIGFLDEHLDIEELGCNEWPLMFCSNLASRYTEKHIQQKMLRRNWKIDKADGKITINGDDYQYWTNANVIRRISDAFFEGRVWETHTNGEDARLRAINDVRRHTRAEWSCHSSWKPLHEGLDITSICVTSIIARDNGWYGEMNDMKDTIEMTYWYIWCP